MNAPLSELGQSPAKLAKAIRSGEVKPVDVADTPTPYETILQLDQVSLMGDTQPRAALDDYLIAEYAEGYRANADFPPIVVFFDGATYWLVDGFHRRWAAIKAGLKTLPCIVHQGTLQDARWFSYAVNQTHGLRRSNADKEKAVQQALHHEKGAGMSDNAIAEYLGVSHPFVGKIRKQLEADSSLETVTSRTGKDGRRINTAKIGKNKPVDDPVDQPVDVEPTTKGPCAKGGEHEWTEDDGEVFCRKCYEPGDSVDDEPVKAVGPKPKKAGKGVELANEAINVLKRIPRNDPFRQRAGEIVTDWCKRYLE